MACSAAGSWACFTGSVNWLVGADGSRQDGTFMEKSLNTWGIRFAKILKKWEIEPIKILKTWEIGLAKILKT